MHTLHPGLSLFNAHPHTTQVGQELYGDVEKWLERWAQEELESRHSRARPARAPHQTARGVCVCVCVRERERESVCVCVCV